MDESPSYAEFVKFDAPNADKNSEPTFTKPSFFNPLWTTTNFNQPNLNPSDSGYQLSDKWKKSLDFIDIAAEDGGLIAEDSLLNSNILTESEPSKGDVSAKDEAKTGEIASEEELNYLELLDIAAISILEDTLALLDEPDSLSVGKNTWRNRLEMFAYGLEPTNYELGVSSNLSYGFATDYFDNLKIGTGIGATFTFANQIKLSTDLVWNVSAYSLDNISTSTYPDTWLASLPALNPIAPNDQLNKIEARMHTIEMPIGLDYVFQPYNHKWSPYVGLGLIARYHFAQQFEYKFLQAPSYSLEYGSEYIYTKYRAFGVNAFTAQLGAEYYWKNWTIRLGAQYVNDFQAHGIDNKQFQYINTRLGVLYRFR